MSTDADIVIVGGGAAGIAAARRIASTGRSALLLEAGPRLGGRAWTHRIRGLDLDLGCGWLHSADRNGWATLARDTDVVIDRRTPAWGTQFRDLGFSREDQAEARKTFSAWMHRLTTLARDSDCAADALESGNRWNWYIRAIVNFISGARLEDLSAADYLAYDETSTDENWRVPMGYGALIARAHPETVRVRLCTPVESIALNAEGVTLGTPAGRVRARAAILTASTRVLASDALHLPTGVTPWLEAASRLPLGRNEKLFLEIVGANPFEDETQVYGNPGESGTGAYYIRPLGFPVIECFFGGEGAQLVEVDGPAAAFAVAIDQLANLFGAGIRQNLKPLVASNWGRMDHIGGAYSYAKPRAADARVELARPFEQRLFFAGEATSESDFSTAHGAYDSGVRAADESLAALGSA